VSSVDDRWRRYVIRLGVLIREATQTCSAKSEAWNRLNDEFNDWYSRQFPGPRDIVHYVALKKANLGLQDAEAGWSHWEREVVRLTAALNAEKILKEILDAAQ
jgi:hypothetical protein